MSVILLLAASLIAAAAALANPRLRHPARPAHVAAGGGSARPAPAPADDRGITLQTLIITAVLVLLAVAVGVVIIAVTGSSSDDLEESAADVAGNCSEVEIYDPEVASRNEKGVQIALTNFANPRAQNISQGTKFELIEFEGSDIGCVPVCVWIEHAFGEHHSRKNRELEAGEVIYVRDLSQRPDIKINVEDEHFFSSDRRFYLLASGDSLEEITYFAREKKENNEYGDLLKEPINDKDFAHTGVTYMGDGANTRVNDGIVKVAVSPNHECLTYDEYGNILLHN